MYTYIALTREHLIVRTYTRVIRENEISKCEEFSRVFALEIFILGLDSGELPKYCEFDLHNIHVYDICCHVT